MTEPELVGEALVELLEREGFATVDLLDAAEVRELRTACDRLELGAPDFSTTTGHVERSVARVADRLVTSVLGAAMTALLSDCRPFAGAFMIKGPRSPYVVDAHPDWLYVDERRGRSYLAWCPLVDCPADAGALRVVPRSHRWPHGPRGSAIPSAYREVQPLLLHEISVPIELPAGRAVVVDAALLHGSLGNRTTTPRTVAAMAFCTKDLPLVHHRAVSPERVDVYAVDHRFFAGCWPSEVGHHYRRTGTYDLVVPAWTEDEVLAAQRAATAWTVTSPSGGRSRWESRSTRPEPDRAGHPAEHR